MKLSSRFSKLTQRATSRKAKESSVRYLNKTSDAYWPHFTEIVSRSANLVTPVPSLILKLGKIKH